MISTLKKNDTGAINEKNWDRCILFVIPWDAVIMRVDILRPTQQYCWNGIPVILTYLLLNGLYHHWVMLFPELKSKGRKGGRSCSSAVPPKALDSSLGTRSALTKKRASGSIPLFNLASANKHIESWCWFLSLCSLILWTPHWWLHISFLLQTSYQTKGWLEACCGTSIPERLTGKLQFRKLRHTLLCLCSHTSNLFVLLQLAAYLCNYTVKTFFITYFL